MTNPLGLLLAQIEEEDLWQEEKHLARHEFLTEVGKINTNLYYVLNGSLRVFLTDENEEHTIRFGYENSFFGALDSFISNKPTNYSIQAIKKSELKVVSKDVFMEVVNRNADNLSAWHKILEQIVSQQLERELDLLVSSPKERYNRVLTRSPQLFQEIPSKYIASYLRMTPETLSRIKKD